MKEESMEDILGAMAEAQTGSPETKKEAPIIKESAEEKAEKLQEQLQGAMKSSKESAGAETTRMEQQAEKLGTAKPEEMKAIKEKVAQVEGEKQAVISEAEGQMQKAGEPEIEPAVEAPEVVMKEKPIVEATEQVPAETKEVPASEAAKINKAAAEEAKWQEDEKKFFESIINNGEVLCSNEDLKKILTPENMKGIDYLSSSKKTPYFYMTVFNKLLAIDKNKNLIAVDIQRILPELGELEISNSQEFWRRLRQSEKFTSINANEYNLQRNVVENFRSTLEG